MLALTVESRPLKRKELKLLRRTGYLPAIVYGRAMKNLPVRLDYKDFEKVYQETGKSTIIKLQIKGTNDDKKNIEYPVLIRDVQKDPVSEKYLHIDFYRLPMKEKIEVAIPIEFKGKALAEEELGGVLIKNIHELKIKALPQDLVHKVEVDISSLKTFEDTIKVKDIILPSNIEVLIPVDEVVVLVRKEEEEEIEAAPTEEKPEEIEVVKKKKEGEEGEGEGETEEKGKAEGKEEKKDGQKEQGKEEKGKSESKK